MDRTFADCLRVGHGYDVHALAPGLRLRLCGVDLEHDRGCVAHSDGDVAVHALCDALLGAAALGDIGLHFPDTAAEYAGIDSMVLLERCMELLAGEGFGVVNADVTIAVMPVPMEEAKRFGIMITDENKRIVDFEEKPANPRSNLASMGIYIFNWKTLKQALIDNADQPNLDFGKHVIPYCHKNGAPMYAYEFNGYWKDVGTLTSYWEANMELIDVVPEFNLYEEFWKIYTNSANIPPQYIAENAVVDRCIIANGTEIYGEVHSSVLGGSVTVGKGSVVRDSIIMQGVTIGENCVIEKAIIAEDTVIGNDVSIGIGSEVPNKMKPNIYSGGLATIGENSVIPGGVQIGKNTAISGVTSSEDYIDGVLASGETLIKAGDRV